jgi:hypothetical protein
MDAKTAASESKLKMSDWPVKKSGINVMATTVMQDAMAGVRTD